MSPTDFDSERKFPIAATGDSDSPSEKGHGIICLSSLSPLEISDCSQLSTQLEMCDFSLGPRCHPSASKSQGEAQMVAIADDLGLNSKGKAANINAPAAYDDFSGFDDLEGEGHTTDTTDSTFSDGSSDSGSSAEGPDLNATTVVADSGSYPNWKDLMPDVLCVIVKSLPLADNIRFGGVCTNWYSAAAQSCHPLAPQPPFLLLPGDSTGTSEFFQFFDLFYNKFYKIRLPQLCNRSCLGSSQGKLIYIDERAELHVLDPITCSHFDLPSINTFDNVHSEFDEDGNVTGYMYRGPYVPYRPFEVYSIDHLFRLFYDKVIICPKTSAIIAISNQGMTLAICMPGDKSWTMIETRTPEQIDYLPLEGFKDIVFYKDVLYTLTREGKLVSFQVGYDFKAIKFEVVGPTFWPDPENKEFRYLVEAGGELLQVWRYTNLGPGDGYIEVHVTCGFRVFKMNWGSMLWEELKGLGEYVLFLGLNNSFALSIRDFPELKANCIYFTDDDFDAQALVPQVKRDVGVFDLEDGTVKPCYPSDDNFPLNWPPPIWFTPKGLPPRCLNVNLQ